jgi:Flp pilus assembly protein TadG
MKSSRCRSQRGTAFLEFTLVCIPLIFLIISIVELARGMWVYNTLAFSVKRATRFAIVHGKGCADVSASCPVTVGDVAQMVRNAGPGLDPAKLVIVLKTSNTTHTCNPLNSCLTNTDTFPAAPDNNVGLPVTISGTYPFRSALAMFWPGAGAVRTGTVNFGAKSQEEVRF